MKRTRRRIVAVAVAAVFPLALALVASGCAGCSGCGGGRDDADAAASATTVVIPPPPPSSAQLAPEVPDAGADADDASDADASDAKAASGPNAARCCAAIRQNARSAPPDQLLGYQAAAAACDGLVRSGQIGQLRAMLKGANLPAECR